MRFRLFDDRVREGRRRQATPLGSPVARYGLAGSSCFVAGTPVETPAGEVAIESLLPGERVLGFDVDAKRFGTERVVRVSESNEARRRNDRA